MSIKQALDHIPTTIGLMIVDHEADLDDAWIHREDDEGLTISFQAKLSVDPKKGHQCDVSISFVKEKIKDKKSFSWDERQGNLFEPPLESGGIVTISLGDQIVTLGGPNEQEEDSPKIPCLDCANDQEHGGDCDRSHFYSADDGKTYICDEKVQMEEQNAAD